MNSSLYIIKERMSLIKYSLKKQLKLIFEHLCYLAFGEKITTPVHDSNDLLFYKIPISEQLHDHFYQEQFRFAPPNITKKTIAQEIQVHLKKGGDLTWEIDEFGSFKVQPTTKYLNRILQQANQHIFEFLLCDEYMEMPQKPQIHIFDFLLPQPNLKLDEMNLLFQMQSMARIIHHLNQKKVVRNLWLPENLYTQVNPIEKLLFSENQPSKYPIHLLEKTSTKHKNEFKYFACFAENKLHYQKLLPHHKIIPFQHWPIKKFDSQQVCQNLNHLSYPILIVKYSDFIDEFQFEKCERVLRQIEERNFGEGLLLKGKFKKIRLNLQSL